MLTINVAVLPAVVVLLRQRRSTQARSRDGEKLTMVLVLVLLLGVLLAPTAFGQGLLDIVTQLVTGVSDSSR
ncbi:hypothetical protein [Streptomyces cyaneofuscatus]|uniref:DUF2970 domain-containing protein n=1 Tax=Streptomyces cyaneofuscatus TaxID=66883 RepID=A0ABZ1F448_9ACTN|nr:hypothetical protein [Streptomyces cyaneofuscatus]WSB11069.1 hypothetical protein OG849_29380 [Streptomyces cyaneofuscatus]WSD45398.1 hypothetical protein OG857_06025 [Streptomyces cyaneofuscatus]WTA88735.1 hypothetical protein OG323_06835 [Streptomyces cyaneofuscatus]